MKVVYIAGPYRDKRGEWFVTQNIRDAEEAALAIWEAGGVALCPHKNTAYFGGACPDDVWLKGDLELLKRCDAMLVIGMSEGVLAEIEFADQNDIMVFEETWRACNWVMSTPSPTAAARAPETQPTLGMPRRNNAE